VFHPIPLPLKFLAAFVGAAIRDVWVLGRSHAKNERGLARQVFSGLGDPFGLTGRGVSVSISIKGSVGVVVE
jgi:hypothetical protein